MLDSLHYWLALTRIPNVGVVTIKKWFTHFATPQQLFAASPADWREAGLLPQHITSLQDIAWNEIAADLQWAKANACQIISLEDSRYPLLLKEIHDPPLILYVQGQAELLNQPQLAMVGSRNPTEVAKELAHLFAEELVRAGVVVTSGLALGIDAASHQGALVAGKTIAVLGTGLQHVYPRSHEALAEKIRASGALISEFPPNMPPKANNFPIRNRIISGLSLGVIVVEAALRSGSLITARSALEQNREVFAIPGSIHNPLARGCHQLIRQGAKLVETTTDVLEELRIRPRFSSLSKDLNQVSLDLDPGLQRVFALIGYEVTTLNDIIIRSGLTASQVSSMLLALELAGYVRLMAGGYIRVSS